MRLIPSIIALSLCVIPAACAPHKGGSASVLPPITNLNQLAPRLYSGAEPVGDRAFAHLASLNLRTLISVDGAPPDVEAAAQHDIRVVHIPVGYDGITNEQSAAILAAYRASPGPVFIHCHHGQHRGPTAAALCAITDSAWTNDQALSWMRNVAHTGQQYAGLYDTVARFIPPTDAELDAVDTAALPSRAEPSDTVQTMLAIDRRFDRLKQIRKAGWQLPDELQDQTLSADTQLLRDHFDHLLRQHPNAPEDFREALEKSIKLSEQMTMVFGWKTARDSNSDELNMDLATSFDSLRRTCIACHRTHRN